MVGEYTGNTGGGVGDTNDTDRGRILADLMRRSTSPYHRDRWEIRKRLFPDGDKEGDGLGSAAKYALLLQEYNLLDAQVGRALGKSPGEVSADEVLRYSGVSE